MREQRVLELLRASGALLEGHFELSSGLHSDRYFQCALVLSRPDFAAELAQGLAAALGEREVGAVVGPALGAVVLAHEVARALGARSLFSERREGRMELRRGFALAQGERVLVVEDVLTTGGSAREVVRLARAAGALVVGVGALVDRSGGALELEGVAPTALARVSANAWSPAECPLCGAGAPCTKPGSRAPAPAR